MLKPNRKIRIVTTFDRKLDIKKFKVSIFSHVETNITWVDSIWTSQWYQSSPLTHSARRRVLIDFNVPDK